MTMFKLNTKSVGPGAPRPPSPFQPPPSPKENRKTKQTKKIPKTNLSCPHHLDSKNFKLVFHK